MSYQIAKAVVSTSTYRGLRNRVILALILSGGKASPCIRRTGQVIDAISLALFHSSSSSTTRCVYQVICSILTIVSALANISLNHRNIHVGIRRVVSRYVLVHQVLISVSIIRCATVEVVEISEVRICSGITSNWKSPEVSKVAIVGVILVSPTTSLLFLSHFLSSLRTFFFALQSCGAT